MTIRKLCRFSITAVLVFCVAITSSCKDKEVGNIPQPTQNAENKSTQKKGDEQENAEGQTSNEPDYLKKAREQNSDVVGWISIPNTSIDYPVVITDNNDFYINYDIDKKESKTGALFFDKRNNNKDERRNLIIYGHEMKNGTMFHDLMNFKQRDFFENTRQISLWAWGEERKYEVYSQFIAPTTVRFIDTVFDNDEKYTKYIEELRKKSKFKADVKVDAEDEILTLVTCTYENETDDSRCVVQAVRIH